MKKLCAVVLTLSSVIAAAEEEPIPIILELQSKGEIEVYFERADSTATGAALGGLLGAGIESAVRSGSDAEKLEALAPYLESPYCDKTLIEAFSDKLESRGYSVYYEGKKAEEADERASINYTIDINECGFKVANTQTMAVSAFVNLDVEYRDPEGNSSGETPYYFHGKEQFQFQELVDMKEEVSSLYSTVASRAGNRLANKIIYR